MRRVSSTWLWAIVAAAQCFSWSTASAQPVAQPAPPPTVAGPPTAAPPPTAPPVAQPAPPVADPNAVAPAQTATQPPYPPHSERSRRYDDEGPDGRIRGKEVRPRRLDYAPGEVIPPGYIEQDRNDRGLLISGIVVLSSFYGVSLVTAAVGSVEDREPERWGPLLIPVAGPLISIATLETEGVGTYLMVLDAIGQATGVILFATSFGVRDHYLKRVEDGPNVSFAAGLGSANLKLTY